MHTLTLAHMHTLTLAHMHTLTLAHMHTLTLARPRAQELMMVAVLAESMGLDPKVCAT
jgi:hypothetical protein